MEIDCKGRLVFPSFCDPDSHLLYPFGTLPAFSRRGPEKLRKGIGFSESFVELHEMSIGELYLQAIDHLKEVVRKGTGAIEIKSGYGLEAEDEIKLLQVIRKLKSTTPLVISPLFWDPTPTTKISANHLLSTSIIFWISCQPLHKMNWPTTLICTTIINS